MTDAERHQTAYAIARDLSHLQLIYAIAILDEAKEIRIDMEPPLTKDTDNEPEFDDT